MTTNKEKTMDPNKTYHKIVECIETIKWADDVFVMAEEAEELCELFYILDGWLSKGGFLPDKWKR